MTLSGKLLNDPYCNYITGNMPDQVLAYERAGLIFVFNFNPFRSFTDYGINAKPGKYSIILSTDSKKFGGLELTDEGMSHYTVSLGKPGFLESCMLKLYLPARTAFVLKSQPVKNVYDLIE
jgi:1,4-alpha-glucan branching enzyme